MRVPQEDLYLVVYKPSAARRGTDIYLWAGQPALSVSAVVSDCQRPKRKLFRRADDATFPQGNRGSPQGPPEKGWRVIDEEVNRGGSQAGSNRLFPLGARGSPPRTVLPVIHLYPPPKIR